MFEVIAFLGNWKDTFPANSKSTSAMIFLKSSRLIEG